MVPKAANPGGLGGQSPSISPTNSAEEPNNWVSIPYHALANNSFELCKDPGVNPNFPTAIVVYSLVRWDAFNSKPFCFTCGASGFGSFVWTPGEALSLKPTVDMVSIRISVY